jgi:WD40 repeat protein
MTRIQPDTELLGQYEPDDAWRWTSEGSLIYVVSTSPPPELHYSVIYASASDPQQGQSIVLASINGYIHQIALHPDGYHFVGINRDAAAFLWDVRTPTAPILTFDDILRADWSPDGTLLAVLREDGTALIYDTATLEITVQFAATPEATLHWSPDSRRIARHDSGVVFIYDVKD